MKKLLLVLLLLFLSNLIYAQISVEYFGGAGRVSGSCALLKTEDQSIIIDCGSFYDEGNLKTENSFIDKKLINADAMILTHAHNDHSGRIPQLISEGFSGNIYCTDATKKIVFEVYNDGYNYEDVKKKYYWSKSKQDKIKLYEQNQSLTLHWYKECRNVVKNIQQNKEPISIKDLENKYKIKMKICKKCLEKDLENMKKQFVSINLKENIDLTDRINFSLYDAGHITGSASVLFNIYDEKKIKTVAFSGDLGSGYSKITPNKDIIPKVDYVFVETTYGGAKKNVSKLDYEKFQKTIANALKNNKIVWIPALSLHRTQKILYEIKQAQINGLIDDEVAVYSLSPSSNGITKLYESEATSYFKNSWFKDEVYQVGSFLPTNYITKKPKEFICPSIVISASGMMDQGVSLSLVNKLLPLKNVEVCLVSYASPKTPAGKLKKGAGIIRTKYGSTKVLAKVNIFDIFSDHPDIDELMHWLSKQDSTTTIYLVHGESDILKKSQILYKQKGFSKTNIAIKGINVLN